MKFIHLWILATLILSGCNTLSSKAQPSKLEAYSLEQKLPKTSDTKAITIAAANVLQSQDFLIKSSDTEIGFISASKEIMLEEKVKLGLSDSLYRFTFKKIDLRRWHAREITKVSISTNRKEEETYLRIQAQKRTINNWGHLVSSEAVSDPDFYQNIFEEIVKAIDNKTVIH